MKRDREVYDCLPDIQKALRLPGFEQEAASASAEFVPVFGRDESFV